MPHGVFVKLRKSKSPENVPPLSVAPTGTGDHFRPACPFTVLGQLRDNTRLMSIISLIHNQYFIFSLTYTFIFMARSLKNPAYGLDDTPSIRGSEFSYFLQIQKASQGAKSGVFVTVILLLLLLNFQQWTAYRLYVSTDETRTRRESYKLARSWIPINNLLIVVFAVVIIIAFVMDHIQLAHRLCLSLAMRVVTLMVVVKYVLELRKRDCPVFIPSDVFRAQHGEDCPLIVVENPTPVESSPPAMKTASVNLTAGKTVSNLRPPATQSKLLYQVDRVI